MINVVKEETRSNMFSADRVDDEQMKEREDNLKTAKAKMDRVREENGRLKKTLSHIMKDYDSLKTKFNGLIQENHDVPKKLRNLSPPAVVASDNDDESDMVSLSLGRSFSGDFTKRDIEKKGSIINRNENNKVSDGLELGLHSKFHSDNDSTDLSKNLVVPENSSDESKEDVNDSARASDKIPKNSRSGDDEILQHIPLKKPRVSVRALCNTQTMNDGCQWRKYGQKISKGNPCPRAYYRCTVSSSCPVRKQVQRCVDDMSILTTTYEGTHNHPLPPSAITMASATTAAAAMLKCGSSTSPPSHSGASATSSTSPNNNLLGFNFSSSTSSNYANLNISHFPKATISSSQSHPTVVLDLTAPNHTTPSPQNNNKFSSRSFAHSSSSSSPTSLNFSSFDTNSIGWESKFPGVNYQPSLYNNFQISQKQTENDPKIAAITRDPNFRSALAAAITSIVGTNIVQERNTGLNFHPSFLNKFPQSGNPQQKKNLTQFLPLTMSLADEGEQIEVMNFGI
ncbi:hypothetical protein ABFS82_12G105800 [Erythranthe guttata]